MVFQYCDSETQSYSTQWSCHLLSFHGGSAPFLTVQGFMGGWPGPPGEVCCFCSRTISHSSAPRSTKMQGSLRAVVLLCSQAEKITRSCEDLDFSLILFKAHLKGSGVGDRGHEKVVKDGLPYWLLKCGLHLLFWARSSFLLFS